MYFVLTHVLIEVVQLTISNELSTSNPATIQNAETKKYNAQEPELSRDAIVYFGAWNNDFDSPPYNEDLIETLEDNLSFNIEQQNKFVEEIKNEQNDERKASISRTLQQFISYGSDIQNEIQKIKSLIKNNINTNNTLLLKIIPRLELNKLRHLELPNNCEKNVVEIQELLLFLIQSVVDNENELMNVKSGLKCPEDINNEFVRSFLKSNEDIVLLEQIQDVLNKLITNSPSNYEEIFIEIQQKLSNLLDKPNLKILIPELLNEKIFVNNIIKTDNNARATLHKEFIKRYITLKSKRSIFVVPLEFSTTDDSNSKVIIRIPILFKECDDQLHIEVDENNNS